MKKLILTGWGWKDYAFAAALALRQHQEADILGMSTRRLPEFLDEVKGYREIIILGVGLGGNPPLLEKALAKLSASKTKVVWISALPLPRSVGEGIRRRIEHHVQEGADGITDAVSRCYGIETGDMAQFLQEGNLPASAKKLHLLLDAAMYMYRNYQDEAAYANAIRHIANGDGEAQWTGAEVKMVAHYLRYGSRELVGKSPAIQNLLGRIILIAPRDHARVMIYGETGTGKETVALQIHNKSPRTEKPFIAFNCAVVTPDLLESRFLGYEKGAFTGATERRHGIFEQAHEGTLFLDEIGELPLAAQGILLRVLEGGRFTRLGGKEEVVVDVRLIVATHRDLAAWVRDGKFREDLFHRLNVIQIRIPPLRDHKEDIAQIADGYWLKQHARRLAPKQIEALMAYDYPGNVRELFNLLERASVMEETNFERLLEDHRQMTASLAPRAGADYPDNLEEMTRRHVRRVYEKCEKNLTKTSEVLGASRNTVRKYLGKGGEE